jgi:hypothetical protein
MTVKALLAMHLTINAVDLSDHVRGTTITAKATELSSEAMGDAWEEVTGGLKSGQLQFELLDDFAAGSVDATLWAAFLAGTNVTFAVRPDTAAVSATNPSYAGSVHPGEWAMGGKLNEMAGKSLTWKISGALARNVT